MHVVRTRIIRWLILWMIDEWVSINVLSWSLYVWITSLNFSYASDVFECSISSTNLKLKIRRSRETVSMMINSNTRFFNKSFISFRLEFSKIEMRDEIKDKRFSNWFESESSFWRKTMISAKFRYLNDRRLARVNLMRDSTDELFKWSDDWTSSEVDWTFSSIDSTSLIDSIRIDFDHSASKISWFRK
jgi:hypothetical protein